MSLPLRGKPSLPAAEPRPSEDGQGPPDRRRFLRTAAAGALLPILGGCNVEGFLRRHFREVSNDDLARMLDRLEREHGERFGTAVRVGAELPIPGVEFGYGLDLSRCIGCRRCVTGCSIENNQSRSRPEIQWIKVLEMEKDKGVDLVHADAYYDPEQVPRPGHFYMPVQCHQCRKPPCVKVCPTRATWQEPDGITVVDYDWCIGCRCCMSACPYGARRFNWAEPNLPAEELNPDTHYLGNRPRMKGVVEKCTFCIQRVRNGRYPACVEVCPVGARKFGNLLDPDSEIRYVMDQKRVFVFKQELHTMPRFVYFYAT
jgi:Fe-S-cluster-containing dehydrogenase component